MAPLPRFQVLSLNGQVSILSKLRSLHHLLHNQNYTTLALLQEVGMISNGQKFHPLYTGCYTVVHRNSIGAILFLSDPALILVERHSDPSG